MYAECWLSLLAETVNLGDMHRERDEAVDRPCPDITAGMWVCTMGGAPALLLPGRYSLLSSPTTDV